MVLPSLKAGKSQKIYTAGFGGLNLTDTVSENEFIAMKNMSSDRYPSLSVRSARRLVRQNCGISEMAAAECLVRIVGTSVYCGDTRVRGLALTPGEKFIVCSDNRAFIFPDKIWVSTPSGRAFGSMEHTKTHSLGAVLIEPALRDFAGAEYVQSETEPVVVSPADFEGKFWLDNGSVPCKLKKYVFDGNTGSFVEVTPDSTRIIIADSNGHAVTDFFNGFNVGDGVDISATENMNNTLSALGIAGDHVIIGKGDGYALIEKKVSGYRVSLVGIIPGEGTFTVSRKVPDLDMAVFAAGRIFGCNISQNRIYASRKDNLCSWYGSSSSTDDPIMINAGTPSAFTAAAVHMGSPVFFKEECIHKIIGNSQTVVRCEGVQNGCEKSVCLIGSTLYYRSREHICAYDGTMPYAVSGKLGRLSAVSAHAGACRGKYYISLTDAGGSTRTLVYDSEHRLWHEEDPVSLKCRAEFNGALYTVTEDGDLICIEGDEGTPREGFDWYAESGDIKTRSGGKKLLSRLTFRSDMPESASASVFVMYEENGDYVFAGSIKKGCSSVLLRTRKSDRIRIRIEGRGPCSILSLVRTFTDASEL